VFTDWILIRRAAAELHARLRGGKIRDVGVLPDGRLAISIWQRGSDVLLCADLFASSPLVTLEREELPVAAEPGFVRAVNVALRNTMVLGVRARRGDRLIRLECGTRSRFGVEQTLSLVFELVPRFGNAILLKGDIVVSALKEFGRGDNAVRAVETGALYEPPPLSSRPNLTAPQAHEVLDAARDVKSRAKALREARPMLSQLLAESLAHSAENATVLLAQADEIIGRYLSETVPDDPVHAYRKDGQLQQVHVVPLEQFASLEHETAPALLPFFTEARTLVANRSGNDRIERTRRELLKLLSDRERKARDEYAQVETKLARAAERESLREEGEGIYAHLYELPEAQRDAEKERATKAFARYKKLAASVEHLEQRKTQLANALEAIAELRWEAERAQADDLADVREAAAALEPHVNRKRSGSAVQRRRKPLQFLTQSGSRIYVGRTPIENAELTFRVARPDDLWFHVQNQPGAHVILQRDDRAQPHDDDITAAASLAALHSKAKTSPKVTVDFTPRKYVRKRPSAAPGLVFYTNPRSIVVAPMQADGLRTPPN
jgi:predicted ribosome quality control (RQC) complex YloA/Tae2 family protein